MVDGIEERLAAAAARLRGHDLTAAQVTELARRRDALTAEVGRRRAAMAAAGAARDALAAVQASLDSASGWSTYDTFFGGGAISSAIKHSRLDEAARQAAHADRCLLALRTELADVTGVAHTAPQLAIDGLTRFADIWFDNIFTDLAVRGRIKRAQENVGYSTRAVREVARQLGRRDVAIRTRLSGIEADRLAVLTGR